MKVSVVTPSYNQAEFLPRTLQSVRTQEGVELEHIVVDACSQDDSVSILRATEGISWISEPDSGQAQGVNKGIRLSSGDIIGWLNSDDIYYPGALSQVVSFFEMNPDVDVLYADADHIDIRDVRFEDYPAESWKSSALRERCFICQPSTFFRRSVVEKHGGLDESLQYCMDYEYWLRLDAGGCKFAYVPRKLAGSRLYPENKTLRDRLAVHKEINGMLSKSLGQVPDAWIYRFGDLWAREHFSPENTAIFSRVSALATVISGFRWNLTVTPDMLHELFPNWFRRA